jgi:YbbR domain-containing protein
LTRAVRFLVRNWPLKAAAVVFATLLYGMLVVSQNERTINVSVPVSAVNQPSGTVLLSNLDSVTQVKFFAPQDTGPLDSSSFRATVDLTNVDPKVGRVLVPVHVQAIDDRIQVLEVRPSRINIDVDQLATRTVSVVVSKGPTPSGLDVRAPELSSQTVTLKGPATEVRRVDRAEARIQLDPGGIDFDRDVELIPVDALGNEVAPVEVEPATVRVRVAVFTDRRTRSLPVHPNVTGTPAAGFEVATVAVQPLVLTVEGDADQLASLSSVDTAAVSVAGATGNVSTTVGVELPTGVLPLGGNSVRVTIGIRQVTATRTFSAGILLTGARADRVYNLSTDHVLVTLGGSIADLDGLEGRAFSVQAPVGGLDSGRHEVAVTANLPAGLTLVSATPPSVIVTVALPSSSPAASAAP